MRLLVTGVSGFLGWHICREALVRGWDVVAVCFRNPVDLDGVDVRVLDLCDEERVNALFEEVKPDAVIHAAAMANPNQCEVHPELSEAVNVTATGFLAELCGVADIPLVFTSTDLVFDGENAPYCESDTVSPISVYGRHKVAAEKLVLESASKGLVCRMPLMFGLRDGEPASFIGPWFENLRQGEVLTLFDDEIRTPVSGHTAASGLLSLLEAGVGGLFHLGGHEAISRYKFGLQFCDVFGFSPDLIKAVPSDSIRMAAPRSLNVALDSRRAFALGYAPGTIRDQLEQIKVEV